MTREIDTIIINSLNKLDSKIDKIEDSLNDVKSKVSIVEERQNHDRESHKDHENISIGFKKKLDEHLVHDADVQTKIFSQLQNYNELLNVHIEGVNTLKQLHLQNAERISISKKELGVRLTKLEEPIKAKAYLYKKYIKIGGLITLTAAIITSISKLIGLW